MASPSDPEANSPGAATRSVFLRLLATYVRPYAALIALAILLAGAVSGAQFLRAYLLMPLVDSVFMPAGQLSGVIPRGLPGLDRLAAGHSSERSAGQTSPPIPMDGQVMDEQAAIAAVWENFAQVALLGLIVMIALPVAQFGRTYVTEYVLGRVHIDLQRDVCAKLLALPLRFHHEQRRGDVLSRTLQDVRSANDAVRLLFDNFVLSIWMTLTGIGMMFFLSWQLAAIFAVLGPALFGVITLFTRRVRTSARKRQETLGVITQRLVEILEGIKVVKAFRAEALENAGFRQATNKLFRRSMRVVKYRVLSRSLVEMLNNGMAIGIVLLGAVLVVKGRWGLTPGGLTAFAAVAATTYKPLKALARGWVRLADALPSAERFFEVIDDPVEIRDATDAVVIDKVTRGIRLNGVAFSYGREPVLHDISFEVRAGEAVAIVGPTGSGKTTLVDLMLRFYDPTAGSIEIDGVDLRRIQRDSLYRHIGVVTQEPFLFDGTIRDNIRYGKPGAQDEEVLAAARAAHVDEFVQQLSEAYDTEVGAGGVRLSGGQRQRVTIARAILRNPAILIFDEATSSLDSQSERYVQDAIEALLGGRTVLMIAHRLSTIARADKIIVLENGTIAQMGTHPELMACDGLYQKLIHLQETKQPAHSSQSSVEENDLE